MLSKVIVWYCSVYILSRAYLQLHSNIKPSETPTFLASARNSCPTPLFECGFNHFANNATSFSIRCCPSNLGGAFYVKLANVRECWIIRLQTNFWIFKIFRIVEVQLYILLEFVKISVNVTRSFDWKKFYQYCWNVWFESSGLYNTEIICKTNFLRVSFRLRA